MADLKLKLKDAADKTFSLPTNQSHTITLVPPKVFVLDVEDAHFNTSRRVLLPDLTPEEGPPVLDARRVTGLGVLYAALYHADKNPNQGLFVTGHADASGGAAQNQSLSEDRAAGVSLLLRGLRDDWRKLSAKHDAVDDFQTVLRWQHQRAGWDCDPGAIHNKLDKRTRAAVKRFQAQYNAEVEKAASEGADTPFKQKISVDGDIGPETWGAVYDLYMEELMDLLELDGFSSLSQRQAKLKAPPGMVHYVGCGEHIAFNAARRDAFEDGKDERLEGPQKNPSDRRVEILFFDPGEEVELTCHSKPGQCKPKDCPIYLKVPHRQQPIGIPKGLPLTEVNLRLTFIDPEGKVRPLPAGIPVQAKFGEPPEDPPPPPPPSADEHVSMSAEDFEDEPESETEPQPESAPTESAPAASADEAGDSLEMEQEPTAYTGENGSLQFVIPRRASALYLRFLVGDARCFVTADPKVLEDAKLSTEDEALAAAAEGRVFFRLPPVFHTRHGYFEVPSPTPGLSFKDGAFRDIDSRKTQIGSRDAPQELRLNLRWQHFKFQYFDRFTSALTCVPQPRTRDADGKTAPVLVLQGVARLVEADEVLLEFDASSAWDVTSGQDTLHCLAWIGRELIQGQKARELPDEYCTTTFSTGGLYVRTEGEGSSRSFVTLKPGDAALGPSVDRLRLYDLPGEWRTRLYPARMGGEATDKSKPFEQLAATASTRDKPYVISLDVIVVGAESGSGHDSGLKWDDSKLEHRFTIFDDQLRVYKPDTASKDTYFTRLAELKPAPSGACLVDHAPFTRALARGYRLYDVFDLRSEAIPAFKGAPVGARLAKHVALLDPKAKGAVTSAAAPYTALRPNATNPGIRIGSAISALLRCCGREQDVEIFRFIQLATIAFDFSTKLTPNLLNTYPMLKGAKQLAAIPADADQRARTCLNSIAKRWNGGDSVNAETTHFEVDAVQKAKGHYHAFLSRGPLRKAELLKDGEILVNVIEKGRAFMNGRLGFWELAELAPQGDTYTGAHEIGHVFSQPDEYLNRDFLPSYGKPNIGEAWRSAGTPYGLDGTAMMVGNEKIRARYFWDMLLFARDRGHFTDSQRLLVKRGSHSFTGEITAQDQSCVRLPKIYKLNVKVGAHGACDLFVYVTGRDEYLAGDLTGQPFDGLVMVRVKMAWRITTTASYDELWKYIDRAYDAIHKGFNGSNRLAVRAKVDGRAVRLRVLFAPRFICSTFPTDGSGRTSYLNGIEPSLPQPFKASDYEAAAQTAYAKHGVHVDVRLEENGSTGVQGNGIPRRARVRPDKTFLGIFSNSRFDDDVVDMFNQLIGAPVEDERTHTPADFEPLLAAVSSLIPGARAELVS